MYISTKRFIFSVLFLLLLYGLMLPGYLLSREPLDGLMALIVLGYGLWLLVSGVRWRRDEQALLKLAKERLEKSGAKKLSSEALASEIGRTVWAVQIALRAHQRKGKLPPEVEII